MTLSMIPHPYYSKLLHKDQICIVEILAWEWSKTYYLPAQGRTNPEAKLKAIHRKSDPGRLLSTLQPALDRSLLTRKAPSYVRPLNYQAQSSDVLHGLMLLVGFLATQQQRFYHNHAPVRITCLLPNTPSATALRAARGIR